MKKFKKVLSALLVLALIVSIMSTTSVGVFAAADDVNEYSVAAMALDDEYAYDGELGCTYTAEYSTFNVWAPTATEVSLNLYSTGSDDEEGAAALGTYEMKKSNVNNKFTGVWNVTVKGDLLNLYYTYSVTAPTSILGGKTKTYETQDVYSYACGVNSERSMIVNLDSTDPHKWDSDKHIFVDSQSDAVVWELQIKDFSYSESSGVTEANRGKYLAFTETGTTLNNEGDISTCVDYLKSLGVTHVQINPFYDFGSIDEAGDDTQFNWGYDPVNYGVPEGSFSSNPYDGNVRIEECKQMIQALHNAGIGVIMDVVYNHTFSRDSCFNRTVPQYYYRMNADGTYSNQSGCSNDTASERAMYRRYMLDMIKYWVTEYHIDGYRFDLMGIHDVETMNLIRDMLDEIDPRIIMYGEGWSGNTATDPVSCTDTPVVCCTQGNASLVSDRIGFFNDQLRDGLKGGVFDGITAPGYLNGAIVYAPAVSYGIRANTYGKGCRWEAKGPSQCVTYASCHDNFTLYDKLTGTNHGTSADFRTRYADVITQNKLSSAITLSSQGINLMLAGEEMGRSKDGDENSYKSPATLNMIDWNLLQTNADLVSYYKGMMQIRKAFSPFTADKSDSNDDSYAYYFSTSMASANRTIAYTVENNTAGEWNKVAVIFNGGTTTATQTLKSSVDKSLSDDTQWVIIANDKAAGVEKLGEVSGLTFTIPPSSTIIAVEKSTFESRSITPVLSNVSINHIDNETGEIIRTNTISGLQGETYNALPDSTIPLKYELVKTEGEVNGVFSDNDAVVNYYYDRYIPSSLTVENGDVNGDNSLSIIDATTIQRHLALLQQLSSDSLKKADYDYSKNVDIIDATTLQRFLAKLDVGVCSLTVNYVSDDGKDIASPHVTEVRLGYEYTTTPIENVFYRLSNTPENASGIVSGNTAVNYTYKYTADTITAHIKHDGDLTWNPHLWAWADNADGTKSVNCFPGWPGVELTECDENGWFTTQFGVPVDYIYSIIVNSGGSVQTENYTDLTAPEIWVVIHDQEATTTGYWISVYDDAELTNKIA